MRLETWPELALPAAPGPRFCREVQSPADLRGLRAALRQWLTDTDTDTDRDATADLLDSVLMSADELASNGLRHGTGPVSVLAVRTDGGLLLQVADGDLTGRPTLAHGRDPSLGGMGLRMVARVTVVRGWTIAGGRKIVWVCIPDASAPADAVVEPLA